MQGSHPWKQASKQRFKISLPAKEEGCGRMDLSSSQQQPGSPPVEDKSPHSTAQGRPEGGRGNWGRQGEDKRRRTSRGSESNMMIWIGSARLGPDLDQGERVGPTTANSDVNKRARPAVRRTWVNTGPNRWVRFTRHLFRKPSPEISAQFTEVLVCLRLIHYFS